MYNRYRFLTPFVFLFFLSFSGTSFACCGAAARGAADALRSSVMNALGVYENAVTEQLKTNAADQISTTEALRKSLLQAMDALTAEMEQYNQEIAKRQEQYKTEVELDKTYGLSPQAMQKICDDAQRGAAAAQAVSQGQATAAARASNVASWSRGTGGGGGGGYSPVKAISDGAKLQDPQLDATRLTDLNNPMSDSERQELLKRMVNYVPPQPISDEAAKTPQGVQAKAMDNERKLRESVVTNVLSEVDAQTTPAVDYNGKKMSVQAIIEDAINQIGFASTDYRAAINTMEQEDLLRQVAVQQMFGNFVQRQLYQLELKNALLEANITAVRQNAVMDERLLEARNRLATQ